MRLPLFVSEAVNLFYFLRSPKLFGLNPRVLRQNSSKDCCCDRESLSKNLFRLQGIQPFEQAEIQTQQAVY